MNLEDVKVMIQSQKGAACTKYFKNFMGGGKFSDTQRNKQKINPEIQAGHFSLYQFSHEFSEDPLPSLGWGEPTAPGLKGRWGAPTEQSFSLAGKKDGVLHTTEHGTSKRSARLDRATVRLPPAAQAPDKQAAGPRAPSKETRQ